LESSRNITLSQEQVKWYISISSQTQLYSL